MPKRPARKGLTKHLQRPLISVLLSIVSLVLMVAALATESILLMLVTGLSVVATGAHIQYRRKRALQAQRKKGYPAPSKPRPAPKAEQGPRKATAERVPQGVVLCTDTSKPIDDCDCATRHVATADGAHRYGLPIGSPIGKRKKSKKPSMTKSSATR